MLGGIAATWSGLRGRRDAKPASTPIGVGTESSQNHLTRQLAEAEPVRSRRPTDWLEHHTAAEHAALLLRWIQENVDRSGGMLFREAVQEFYAEAVNAAGWNPRPWNPVARELDLLCTGGGKPYQWVMSATGRMRRRRHYPIPARAIDEQAQRRAA